MFGGFFEKLKSGLSKTRSNFTDRINLLLGNYLKIDEDLFDELEEILITADIGVDTSIYIIEKLKEKIKNEKIKEVSLVKDCLKSVIAEIMTVDKGEVLEKGRANIILVIGVNGAGKTTSIGKLSNKFKNQNLKVLLAAADTFRAAAIEQLEVWSKRSGVDLIKHQEGSDPAAVVFDAIQASKARGADVLICDTAGRLHNKKNLMSELEKINRIIDREYSEAKKQTFLVLDATTGQNAINQAVLFNEVCKIDGIVLTKLDGSSKGGVVIAIKNQLNIPVRFVGVGEGIDDLQDFNPEEFVEALF